jgi:HEAT repeat protein/glucose/arabinose dehydrogenase
LLAILLVSPGLSQVGPSVKELPAERKLDFTQPQSPLLDSPKWVKIVDAGAGYRIPDGMKLDVVREKTTSHILAMTFSEDGKPYLLEQIPGPVTESTETIKYRDGTARTFPRVTKKTKDVVHLLSSSKKAGVWDQTTRILEDDDLSDILFHDGWLYVAGQGTVRRHKRSKPTGPFDEKEVVARGFAQVSGLCIGPDGWLYLNASAGDHHAEGSDGTRATVLRSGAIFRCRPNGGRLHLFALGVNHLRQGGAFDLAGHLFHIDDDVQDGSKFTGCRLLHLAEGADLGWRIAPGGTEPDSLRAAVFGELSGKMPGLLKTGKGTPGPLFVYNDSRFPEEYRGLLFYPDPQRRLIRAYRVDLTGASFKVVEEFEVLAAPKDASFQPRQMILGPDGAIYVLESHGRIVRLGWAGTKEQPALVLRSLDSWAKVTTLKDDELIQSLSSDETSDREFARRELVRRGEKNRPALVKLLLQPNVPVTAKLAAVGALSWMYNDEVQKAFLIALRDGDEELQRVVAKSLGLWAKKGDRQVSAALIQMLANEDRAIRRAVAVAMGRLATEGAAASLATALSFDESKDVMFRDGVVRALEMLGKPGIDALIALADSGVQKDSDRVAEVFLGLRTRSGFDALGTVLRNPHLNAHQRAELVRSSAHYLLDPMPSLEPLVAQLSADRKESAVVHKAMLEVLGSSGLKAGEKARAFLLANMKHESDEWRIPAIRAAGVLSVKEGLPTITAILDAKHESGPARRAAFRALTALDSRGATARSWEILKGSAPLLQREAIAFLGESAAGACGVADLLRTGKLPARLKPDVVVCLRKHATRDRAAAKLLDELTKSK